MGPPILTGYLIRAWREVDEDGNVFYLATHPEFGPGLLAQGATPEAAIEMLHDAREGVLELLREKDLPIPIPGDVWQATVTR